MPPPPPVPTPGLLKPSGAHLGARGATLGSPPTPRRGQSLCGSRSLPAGRGWGCKLQGAGHVNTDQGLGGAVPRGSRPPQLPEGPKPGDEVGVHKPQPSPLEPRKQQHPPGKGVLEQGIVTLNRV